MGNKERAKLKARNELIEKSMRQARIERSKVVWGLLQKLFSRPEAGDSADAVSVGKAGFRLG